MPRLPSLRHHLLVVDDDDGIRKVLKLALCSAGYEVRCAEDGEEGWNIVRTESIDLLISDHEMPRLTGLELLRRIRLIMPSLPVILISGCAPWIGSTKPAMLSPGAMLAKPFSFQDLLSLVASLLQAAYSPDSSGRIENEKHGSR